MAAVNQALLRSSICQSELTEAAELRNAVLADEINNPLDAVMNLLFLAQTTDDLLPETALQYLRMADDEVERIASLTRLKSFTDAERRMKP